MPTVYEVIHTEDTEGHAAWVKTREALPGGKLPASVRKAKVRADHNYDDCTHPYRCRAHRAAYDRLRKANKRQQEAQQRRREAEARDRELQERLQHQRAVRKIAAASQVGTR